MSIVRISDEMKSPPLVLSPDASLNTALKLMDESQIRHVPITKDGELLGILSDRVVKQANMLDDREALCVADIMNRDPFVVFDTALVSEVLNTMIERKEDCAVVVDSAGTPVGIFTSSDGMKLLRRTLDQEDPENRIDENISDCFWRVPF